MLFNSLPFLVFFVLVYGAYLLTMKRLRLENLLLLVASCVFYGYWDWRFLSLLFASTVLDFVIGGLLDRRVPGSPEYARSPGSRKALLLVSVAGNLGMLGFFKYFNFFVGSAAEILRGIGLEGSVPALDIVLPVGISFYTFQTMSYTIDVYRGNLRQEPSFLNFAVFVSLFPQLVAGPIERASNLLPQIRERRTVTRAGVEDGAWLVFWGLFKKIFVADNLGKIAALGFATPPPDGGVALVAVYAFAFQIYCDFSGYTDVARGCARAMGFEFMRNFDLPYMALNPGDFWRRWHISLSSWLRDYLYIPLGGNREGTWRTYRNLMLTMVLGGLWHGAAWTFVAWGALHGVMLIGHRLWSGQWGGEEPPRSGAAAWGRRAVLFHFVCLTWLLFRADSMGQAAQMFSSIVGDFSLAGARFESLAFYCLPLLAVEAAQWITGDEFAVRRLHWIPRGFAYAGLWFLMTLLGDYSGGQFIYFQF